MAGRLETNSTWKSSPYKATFLASLTQVTHKTFRLQKMADYIHFKSRKKKSEKRFLVIFGSWIQHVNLDSAMPVLRVVLVETHKQDFLFSFNEKH